MFLWMSCFKWQNPQWCKFLFSWEDRQKTPFEQYNSSGLDCCLISPELRSHNCLIWFICKVYVHLKDNTEILIYCLFSVICFKTLVETNWSGKDFDNMFETLFIQMETCCKSFHWSLRSHTPSDTELYDNEKCQFPRITLFCIGKGQ